MRHNPFSMRVSSSSRFESESIEKCKKNDHVKGNTKTLLLVGGTAAGIFLYDYLSKKWDTVNKLSASVTGLKLGQFDFPNLQLQISLLISNQSQNDAVASRFSGSVTDANGAPVGSFSVLFNNGDEIVIPRLGQATVTINSVVNVLSTAAGIVLGKQLLVDGTVVVDGIPVPVQTDILSIGCGCSIES